MAGFFFLLLVPIAVLTSPDLRSNPIALIIGGLCLLAVIGLAYGKYLQIASQHAMIDLDKRDRRR